MKPVILERPTRDGHKIDQTPAFNRPAYWYVRGSDRFPSTDAAFDAGDPIVRVKLFNPQGSWSWFLAGYDPTTRLAFGAVDGWAFEIGDMDMPELTALRGKPFGLPIERDLSFQPCRLSALIRQVEARR